ncbi:MAG: ferrochelatase [Aquabacterium sp.]
MRFAAEPPALREPGHAHGQAMRTGILLVNLGTPAAPTPAALRRYLGQFLWDPRVVEIPRPVWWLILHGIVLRLRPAKSAAKYASIWMPEGSPLAVWTQRLSQRLTGHLGGRGVSVLVRHAMRYGQPSIASQLDALKAQGVNRILLLPLYPQYAAATTASAIDDMGAWLQRQRVVPECRVVNHFHDDPGYIDALAASVRRHWEREGRGDRLVMSFHGLPARSLALGDPYHCECLVTARLLRERLGLTAQQVQVTFQSRFGRARWLQPYTEPTLQALAAQGVRRVDVICPGFIADCLETLEEISVEARATFLAAGGQALSYIPCLNDDDRWVQALGDLVLRHLQGWPLVAPDPVALEAQRQRALAAGAAR